MNSPHVTLPVLEIPAHITAWIEAIVAASPNNERFGLSYGPKASFALDADFVRAHNIPRTNVELYTTCGRVAPHRDNAGDTYGLVLIAEGGHNLHTGSDHPYRDQSPSWNLTVGSVYHINSNEDHGTSCQRDSQRDLLAILTLDFHGCEPGIPYEIFAHQALAAMEKFIAAENNSSEA